MLETRYRERIGAAIAEVTGEPCRLEIAVDGESAEDETPRHGTSRRAHSRAEASQYDRPALFAAPDESLPEASRNPDTSSPRQSLPPAASSTRSERIRAALDRNRASSGSGSSQRNSTGDRDPHIAAGR